MTDPDTIAIELALRALNADFCYFVDHCVTDDLADLFTEDAIYTHGTRESRGRAAIHALFEKRNQSGTRVSRHLQSGLRLHVNDGQSACGSSVCMTFAADTIPPVPHSTPHLIADFIDEYQLCPDGRWRISRRHIERIFVAPGNEGPVGSTEK